MRSSTARRPPPAGITHPDTVLLRDVMTTDVRCVRRDTPLTEVTGLLLECGFSGVPVIDAGGAPVGVLSRTDLLSLAKGGDRGPRAALVAGDLMTPITWSLPSDASLARAAALMAFEGIHRLPIVEGGKVVGILSALDVLRWVAESSGLLARGAKK